MSTYVLSQVLIAIAIVFDLASFQFKKKEQVILCLFFSGVLIGTHFLLLEHYTAASLMLIAVLRYFVSLFSSSKKWLSFFLFSSFIATTLTFSGLLSVLSFIGSSLHSIGAFCKEDKTLRLVMMLGTLFWLVHNALANSFMAVIMEALFLGSNIVGYYRYYVKPKALKKSV